MSIERQAVAGLKWTAGSKLVVQVFAWAVTLFVIRLLAPADYGLMAMVAVVISIATTVAELGLGASIVQSRSLPREELAHVAGVVILLNLAIGGVVAASAPLVAWGFGEPRLTPLVQAMSLQFVFSAIGSVPQALMSRGLNFKRAAWIELASGLTVSTATLTLALLQFGVWSIAIGALAGGLVRTLLLVIFGNNVRPAFRLRGIRAHLRYGGMMTVTRMGWDLILQTDVMIASRFLSTSAIGIYSVGLHLATLPMQKIMSVVNQVAFATVARLQDDPARLRDGLLSAFRLATLASVPLLWGLSSCAPEVVRLLLGPKWEDAIFPVQVMSLVIPVRLISGLMWTAVTAVGRVEIFLQMMVIGVVVFPSSFLVGAQWGLEGIALACPIAWLINFSVGFPRVARAIRVSMSDVAGTTVVPLLAGLPMMAAIALTRLATASLSDLYRLPLLIAAGSLVYLVVISILKPSAWVEMRRALAIARG